MRGVILKLFKLYFTNRYQKVKINNGYGNEFLVKYSMPQETVLGPLLFNIYINGLLNLKIKEEIL